LRHLFLSEALEEMIRGAPKWGVAAPRNRRAARSAMLTAKKGLQISDRIRVKVKIVFRLME